MVIPKLTPDIDERVRLCKGFTLAELASYVESEIQLDPTGGENGRLAGWLVERIHRAIETEREAVS